MNSTGVRIADLPAALALVTALGLAGQGYRLLYPAADRAGWLWCAAAALLAAVAFVSLDRRQGEALPAGRAASSPARRRLGLGLALILAGLLAAALVVGVLATVDDHRSMRWLWLAALGLLLAGSYLLGALGAQEAQPEPARPRWLEIAGFLLLVALAVWLRVDRLQQMPPGIFVDETNAALDAVHILEGRPDSPFGVGWFETPTLYIYYLAGLFRLLGVTFIALKAASLIPAILTVAAIYPLARLLFGAPTALAATFILATNRWHMTMSRWGWNEVAPLLFMIVALFFLLRGLRDRRASDFAWGGLWLGLGHYTYLASRLAALTVALYLVYRILFERRFLRRAWRGLLLFVLLYLAALAPLAVTYIQDPFTFSNRSQQVSILHDMEAAYQQGGAPAPAWVGAGLRAVGLPAAVSLEPLGESVQRHLEMFHLAGDRNPRHNLPGAPMLDPVTGSLLLLGLGYALWRALRPGEGEPAAGGHRYGLLLLWLSVPLLGGVLTRLNEAPQAYRTLPVVGAVALLAANVAVRIAGVLGSALSRQAGERKTSPGRALAATAMAGLLLWAGLLNYRLFFDVQARDGRVWQAFSPVETAVATEVVAKMADHALHLSPRLYYFSPLSFLAYRSPAQGGGLAAPSYQVAEPVHDLPLSDPFGQDALFLLDTYYQDLPDLFLRFYPGAQFELVEGPGGQPLYLSVTVPGQEVRALQGLRGLYATTPGQDALAQPYDGAPRFLWPADLAAQSGPEAIARWSGSLQAPYSGTYALALDGPGRLLLDGASWTGRRFLGKGLHALAIEQTEPGGAAQITLSWQPPAAAAAEPVPPNFFFAVDPPANGLHGEYFSGELWEGDPVFSRIDPVLLFAWPEQEPWNGPFSARWTGLVTAPLAGDYHLQLHADDGVRLWLDGELVGESVTPDTVNLIDSHVRLAAGPHAVRIDYFQRGGGKALEFWWQPPGDHLRPVPSGALTPAPQP